MIKVVKDRLAKVTYIGDVCNGSCDSFYHTQNGNLFSIHRKLDNVKEVSDVDFSEFEGIVSGLTVTFTTATDLNTYLSNELSTELILGQEHLDNTNAHPIYYKPLIVVDSVNTDVVSISTTSTLKIIGKYLDFITTTSFIGADNYSQPVTIISQSFDYLEIEVVSNNVEQLYSLTLTSPNNSVVRQINSLDQTISIPDNGVVSPELWIKPTATNNNAIVSLGTFESPLSGSNNGWNDHAYFGPFTATSYLNYEMTVDRLTGASNAYCFIRFNTTNNVSTGGNPRIYIQNGYTLNIYNSAGTSTNSTVALNDKIEVKFTPTSMKVFKNGTQIMTHTGSYNLTNIFINYTAYRVFKATNIKVTTH